MKKNKKTKVVKITGVEDNPERTERLKEWITFFRRNLEVFVEFYLGIKLFPFQRDILHSVGVKDNIMIIGSRAIGKSWIIAVACVAICILYPNSEVVIVASTIDQGGIIVGEKIKKDLMKKSLALRLAIKNIKSTAQDHKVEFYNGSSIVVVPALDSARGRRATFIIFEEFRLIPKHIADSVIEPMSHPRSIPFTMDDKYKNLIYPEQTKLIYISSAGMKTEWIWDAVKTQITEVCNGSDWAFYAFDYSLAVEHGLKTVKDIENARKKNDEITFLMEYCNVMYGESANAYFTHSLLKQNCRVKVPFYPLEADDLRARIDNTSYKDKVEGEIRIISVDIATAGGKDNDNTCMTCIRAIPTSDGYIREFSYQIIYNGMNSVIQCLNIKRLFYDFKADYCVWDLRNNGDSVYGIMTQQQTDPETNITYDAWQVVQEDEWFINKDQVIEDLRGKTLDPNAIPVMYPISANAQINNDIAIDFRKNLQNKHISLLLDTAEAEEFLKKDEDYLRATDQSSILYPFVANEEFISETIQLEAVWREGKVKLTEPSGTTKDRYTSASYGNFFITILERDLLRNEESIDVHSIKSINMNNYRRGNSRLKNIMK